MSEIFTVQDLENVIDYLRDYVKRGEPEHPISNIFGRMFTYACMMKLKLTGEHTGKIKKKKILHFKGEEYEFDKRENEE